MDPQLPLPMDFGPSEPIPFALTARARRLVEPQAVPVLRVVEDSEATPLEERGDTRPARARALRHAGLPMAAIAAELAVDEVVVRAWCGDVEAARRVVALRPVVNDVDARLEAARDAWEARRTAARAEVAQHVADDPLWAVGLALASAVAECSLHGVLLTVSDRDVARRLLAWLREHLVADTERVRVIVRMGSGVATDVASHHWAAALGLEQESVRHTPWRLAPNPTDEQAMIRIRGGDLGATLAGWSDVLLGRA